MDVERKFMRLTLNTTTEKGKFMKIKINVELDHYIDNYERSYLKLDDLMANVGE